MASEIKARLSLDSSSFSKGIDAALSSLSSMSTRIGAIAATAAGALAAIGAPLTAGAFAVGIKNALDFGGSMSDMSARTGVAVKDLVILGQAFENAGMSAEGVGPAINKMQKALTGVNEQGEPTNKTFARLGLDLEKLKGLDAGAQFAAVSQAIAGLKDPAERAAAAIGIFGKSGGEMLALFRDSSAIATATQQVGAQAALLQTNANAMDKVSDAFGAVKATLRGFFVGIVEPLLPLLTQVADWLNQLGTKAVELGQKLGASIATALTIATNLFKTPREQVAEITSRINGLKGKQVELTAQGDMAAVAKLQQEIDTLADKRVIISSQFNTAGTAEIQTKIDNLKSQRLQIETTGNTAGLATIDAEIKKLEARKIQIDADTNRFERLGDLIGLGLKIAFGEAVNYLAGGLRSALLLIPSLLDAVFSADFFTVVADRLVGAAEKFGVIVLRTFEDAIVTGAAFLQIGFEKAVKVFFQLRDFFSNLVAVIEAGLVTAIQKLVSLLPKRFRPEGFEKKTFEENLASAKKNSVPLAPDFKVSTFEEALAAQREAVPNLTNQLNDRADFLLNKAGEAAGRLFAKIGDNLKSTVADFKPADVFNTADWKKQIAALAASLNVPAATLQSAAEAAAAAVPAVPKTEPEPAGVPVKPPERPRVEVDQFAKIGLFSGNAAGGIISHMQKTAENTLQMTRILSQFMSQGISIKQLPQINAVAA